MKGNTEISVSKMNNKMVIMSLAHVCSLNTYAIYPYRLTKTGRKR